MRRAFFLKTIFIFFILLVFSMLIAKRSEASTIQEGIYTIKSAINENYILDVANNSKENKANVEIWISNGGNNQKFYINDVGEGYYTIYNINSGKYLDVEYALRENGANVEQYTFNNGENQKWLIQQTADGNFNIISKCNNLYLDIANGEIKNGTNVLMWEFNRGKNQEFKLEKITYDNNAQRNNVNIEEGLYVISSAIDNKYVLDVTGASRLNCANIELWCKNRGNNQKYYIKPIKNGYYSIECYHSGKFLDVAYGSKKIGTNLEQYTYNGGENQQWIFKDAGNGFLHIVSRCNGLYIDIENGNVSYGTNILMWEFNGGKNQKFKLEKVEDTGRSAEFKKEHPEIKIGIDVSKYNGDIDWNAVKSDGIDYVMVRAGFRGYGETGTLNEDPTFVKNVTGARKAGLDVGVYFFSQAKNEEEGIKEAEYTLSLIRKYDINYPVAIDTEYSSSPTQTGRADNISVEERTSAVKGFCRTIKSNGYKCLIYANNWWLMECLDLTQLSEYKIWLANYTGATQENPLAKPSRYKGDYVMWQYTSTGTIKGIDGNTDCNIYYYLEDKQ